MNQRASPVDRAMTEAQFQRLVIEAAELHGWVVLRTHDSRRSPSGEPDLRLIHAAQKRVLWVELKTATGKLRKGHWTRKGSWVWGQDEVLDLLHRAGQEAYVWRPQDWEDILAILKGEKRG